MKSVCTLLLLLIGLNTVQGQDTNSTERATAALQVRDGFRLRLLASEPVIVDPITARLDSRGRLWVVEMPDYPTGPRNGAAPSGRIKIVEDRDSDGMFEHATVFADGLLFATGVQPYRDGAIVTLAGQIVFMQDSDDDGIADTKSVWFKGFAEQNQQLRANHPTLGPDGLVYVANGLRGGKVESVHPRFEEKTEPVDLRDRDFCFDPDGGWWGAVAGKSQFGMTLDDFGRRIGCSNRNPAMMTPLSLQAVERDPLLAARDAIHDVALAAEKSKVVSRADAWTTSNLHAGQFSAACGVLAAGMEDEYGEWLVTCEPTAYLVQRQRLKRDGSVWVSHREDLEDEFLASTDTWFRPVDATLGSGQSVMIVDMSRAVIEHPDFMPTELKDRPDQWDGQNQGRIWKISPVDTDTSPARLESPDQAYQWLHSDSPWQRQMASQALLEADQVDPQRLSAIVHSQSSSQSRARAALLLRRHRLLAVDDTATLAQSNDARLRALAVELASDFEGGLVRSVELAMDNDPLVLRAVAAALAGGKDQPKRRIDAMLKVAERTEDVWVLQQLGAVDNSLVPDFCLRLATSQVARPTLLNHLIERFSIDAPDGAAKVIATSTGEISPVENSKGETAATVPLTDDTLDRIEAWISGTRRGRRSPSQSLAQLPDRERQVLENVIRAASEMVSNEPSPPLLRARALTIANEFGKRPENLKSLLNDDSPPAVRVAVLPILLRVEPEWTRELLADELMGMSIPLRTAAIDACSRSTTDTKWLMTMIAEGSIPKTVIDPAMAKRFRQHSDPDVRAQAIELLKSDPNREKVLARYVDAAKDLGDPLLGKKLFLEHCSACHQIDGQGTNVGPDISDTRTKTAEALLTSILDPNAAIDASFVQYSVLTLDGRILDGLLIDETAQSVTLQQKGGERVTISRSDIDALQAPGVSLMPEGFEQTLDVESMSHLLAYLKNWRYLKTAIPGTLSSVDSATDD